MKIVESQFDKTFKELSALNEWSGDTTDWAASKKFWAAAKENKIDSESFHKAYDAELKKLGIYNQIFDASGEISYSRYGVIKRALESKPDSWALKAAMKLYGLTHFKKDKVDDKPATPEDPSVINETAAKEFWDKIKGSKVVDLKLFKEAYWAELERLGVFEYKWGDCCFDDNGLLKKDTVVRSYRLHGESPYSTTFNYLLSYLGGKGNAGKEMQKILKKYFKALFEIYDIKTSVDIEIKEACEKYIEELEPQLREVLKAENEYYNKIKDAYPTFDLKIVNVTSRDATNITFALSYEAPEEFVNCFENGSKEFSELAFRGRSFTMDKLATKNGIDKDDLLYWSNHAILKPLEKFIDAIYPALPLIEWLVKETDSNFVILKKDKFYLRADYPSLPIRLNWSDSEIKFDCEIEDWNGTEFQKITKSEEIKKVSKMFIGAEIVAKRTGSSSWSAGPYRGLADGSASYVYKSHKLPESMISFLKWDQEWDNSYSPVGSSQSIAVSLFGNEEDFNTRVSYKWWHDSTD